MLNDFYGCALPEGRPSAGGHWIVETCPGTANRGCGARYHLYLTMAKGLGFCFKCELKIFGKAGLYAIWPELEHQPATKLPEFTITASEYLANPRIHGMPAWEFEKPRCFLIERFVSESMSYYLPIYWIKQEGQMAVLADPLTPEYVEAAWTRAPREDAKWRPVTGTQARAYGFGIRYLPKNLTTVVLCEGIFDILASGLLGQAVALLGTKAADVWPQWARDRGIQNVICWLDSDKKGDEGVLKHIPKFRAWGLNVQVMLTQKDPKKYVQQGPELLRRFLQGLDGNWVRENKLISDWTSERWQRKTGLTP